jgi:hypothetical protein
MMKLPLVLLCLPLLASTALAQDVNVQIQGDKVQVQMPNVPGLAPPANGGSSVTVHNQSVTSQAIGQGNTASVTSDTGDGNDVQDVSVINGEVWIDGEKVPPDAKRFTSKSGNKYAIDRTKNGVKVRSE